MGDVQESIVDLFSNIITEAECIKQDPDAHGCCSQPGWLGVDQLNRSIAHPYLG